MIVSVGSIFYKINRNKENEQNKKQFKHPDGLTYVDTNGNSRFLSNNELAFYTYKKGDYVVEDYKGNIYKNFTEEKRQSHFEELKNTAIRNNETTYCIDDDNHKNDWNCKGKRFKDFRTGDVYVIRCIKNSYYYLNIENGMIVRKTDWQLNRDKDMKGSVMYYDDIHYVDIKELNNKRRNTQDKQEFYLDYKYNANCDSYK